MSFDVGLHAAAQRYFVLGLHAAKDAGDRNLGAHLLNCIAPSQASFTDPTARSSSSISPSTAPVTPPAPPPAPSCTACKPDLRHARRHPRMPPAPPATPKTRSTTPTLPRTPSGVAHFDYSEYAATLGVVHLILARQADDSTSADRAVTLLTQATHARGSHRVAAAPSTTSAWPAPRSSRTGRRQAADTAPQMLPDLNSGRVRDRLRELYDDTHRHRHEPTIAEIRDRLHAGLHLTDPE